MKKFNNPYITESEEIDLTEMLRAVPERMTTDEARCWLEAFDYLDDESQSELAGIRNLLAEKRHTPVTDDEIDDGDEIVDDYDVDEAEAYFSGLATTFDRKKSRSR